MNGMGDTDFDDAAKFARVGMSVNISDIFAHNLLIRTGNKQHLATYAERTVNEKLGISASDPLIDQVHRAMANWRDGDRGKNPSSHTYSRKRSQQSFLACVGILERTVAGRR